MTFHAGSALLDWNPPQLACWPTKADSTAEVGIEMHNYHVCLYRSKRIRAATGRKHAWLGEQPVDDSAKTRNSLS